MNVIKTAKGDFVYCNVRVPLDLRLKATEYEINLSKTMKEALKKEVERIESQKKEE